MSLSFEDLRRIADENGFEFTDRKLREAAEAGARYDAAVAFLMPTAKGPGYVDDIDDEEM